MNLSLHRPSAPTAAARKPTYAVRAMETRNPPYDEGQRLAALHALRVLDGAPDPELDRLTRLASRVFAMPVALVSLLDAEREWFFSRVGLALPEMARALAFCDHAIRESGPLVIADAHLDPRFCHNPAVTGPPRIRFYAGQAVYSMAGLPLGAFCVIDHVPREFGEDERRLLADLAAMAEARLQRLELSRHAQALGQDSLRLEYALRESERRYMALFNNDTNSMLHMRMVKDADGRVCDYRIEAVNAAYERTIGIAREDIEGRLATEVFPGIERSPDFDFREPYASVARSGQSVNFERYFVPLKRWFSIYAFCPAEGECITLFSDITEKKQVEAALREREAALRATFEQAIIGIVHIDPTGHFVRANRAFCEMLGYSEAELREKHSNDITPVEDQAASLAVFERTMSGELDSFTLEKRYCRKDGRLLWCRISVSSVRAEDATRYNLVMVEDITARRQAEAERGRLLLELEAAAANADRSRGQLEAVFESIEDGIAVFDTAGNLILLNQALARMNRFSGVEEMQRHLAYFDRLFELRDNEGRRLPLEQWPASRLLRGERFSDCQLQVTRHDIGLSTYASYSGAPVLDEAGRQVLSVLVHRDITARKALEQQVQCAQRELEQRVRERTAELLAANSALRREQERTRVVLATATDAYVAADADGHITDWNCAAERLFGWRADEVRGRSLAETLIPMRYRDRPDHAFSRIDANDVGGRGREFMARHRDGYEFPVELSLSASRLGEGWAISAFLRDIRQRKESEAALRRAHDELAQSLAAEQEAARAAGLAQQHAEAAMRAAEAANQAKTEFLATMSHEIRTPLNGVIGFNGLLLDGALTEEKRPYAELARRSGESLLHLLNDFLDFSKIEAGRLELEPTDFDPHLEASHALSLVREAAQKKQLQLDCLVEAPSRVCGDAGRLRQILLNLLANAVKFTERGRVLLRCQQLPRDEGGVCLRFEVIDTGIGIDRAARERLFQPFSQADASTTRRYGGSGLGLAICKRLAEAMGGRIGLVSELGRGSTFWVELPFGQVLASAAGPEQLPVTPLERPAGPRGRVLVVEDNPVSQLMAAEMLKRLGCRVDVAGNGLEAVEALRRLPYDLIFMDCDMPIMNGFDATRAIRAEERGRRHVPIVAVTASALKGDSERCMAVGMDDFMSKPFRLQDMARRVETWLGRVEAGPDLSTPGQ
ncbi:MAG: PAS domain S-box protein [Pseudomonadota bacterium]